MQLPPLPPLPELPSTPMPMVPPWRMPQPLAPSGLQRPVVQRKMQAEEAEQQERAEQAQEVLPDSPDWDGDTTVD